MSNFTLIHIVTLVLIKSPMSSILDMTPLKTKLFFTNYKDHTVAKNIVTHRCFSRFFKLEYSLHQSHSFIKDPGQTHDRCRHFKISYQICHANWQMQKQVVVSFQVHRARAAPFMPRNLFWDIYRISFGLSGACGHH